MKCLFTHRVPVAVLINMLKGHNGCLHMHAGCSAHTQSTVLKTQRPCRTSENELSQQDTKVRHMQYIALPVFGPHLEVIC